MYWIIPHTNDDPKYLKPYKTLLKMVPDFLTSHQNVGELSILTTTLEY